MPGRRSGRFLMAVIDGGTLPPALGMAKGLVRRGHRVEVLSDPTAEASARSAGCDFRPWKTAPRMDSIADQTALIADLERGSLIRQFAVARERVLVGPTASYADDVTAAVATSPPTRCWWRAPSRAS